MKAYITEEGQFKLSDMPVQEVGEDEVLISLKVAGLNRRDLSISNRMKDEKKALVLGSDGAGVVGALGANVSHLSVGDEVIINPALRWEEKSDAPPKEFDILGMPDDGTIAEKIVIHADQVEPKPAYLSWEEAGVLALAALTGYRALFTKGELQKGDTLFIPGAGSGVATYIIQFAKAAGARVIVTSRDADKRKKAEEIGADRAIDTASDWVKELENETIDLVIDSVGRATFNRSLEVLKQGGRMVVFGATTEDTVELDIRAFFYGQFKLYGSTMGSREELKELLAFMAEYEIHPVVGHTFTLDDVDQAFSLLKDNKQFGKIAIQIN